MEIPSNIKQLSHFREYQIHNTGLEANWDFSGDPCPIVRYEWEVRRFDGLVVLPMEELPEGKKSAANVNW